MTMTNDESSADRRGRHARRRLGAAAGYSLIEMIIVVAIFGVLTAIAVPNMVSARQAFQMQSASTMVTGRLGEARMESLKRNRRITLTFDGAVRSMTATMTEAGGNVVTVAGPDYLPSGVVFDLGGEPTLAIAFDSMGRLVNPPQQSLTIQYPNSGLSRLVTVRSTGRITIQ